MIIIILSCFVASKGYLSFPLLGFCVMIVFSGCGIFRFTCSRKIMDRPTVLYWLLSVGQNLLCMLRTYWTIIRNLFLCIWEEEQKEFLWIFVRFDHSGKIDRWAVHVFLSHNFQLRQLIYSDTTIWEE